MKNGTMFSGFLDYEVMVVFKTTVYDGQGFLFDLFADAKTEEDFRAYTDKCKSLALYDTDVEAEYGDKLITLSTCEYSQKNGWFAVVAKKMAEKNHKKGLENGGADQNAQGS